MAPAPEDSKYLARWSYDTIAKGRLTSAIRYVGGKAGNAYALTNAKYDKLYRVLNEQYTISKPEGELAGANGVWTITNAYNLDGTLQKRTIPAMGGLGQEVLKYGYTEQRMPDTLEGLTGIVQNTDYLPAGEQIRTTLGVSSSADWTEINRSYETGTKRLARQSVVSETHTGTDADVCYRYDPAGNPVEIEDKATSPTDRQCFTYDGHRRLKSAMVDHGRLRHRARPGECGRAGQVLAVVRLGQRGQPQDGDRPPHRRHHVVRLQDGRPAPPARPCLHRDQEGGRHGRCPRRIPLRRLGQHRHPHHRRQDPGPRLLRRRQPGKVTEADRTTTEFLNDADGNRLIRRDAAGTTLYLGETELRLDKAGGKVAATRYYTHGGQSVAVRTTAGLSWMAADPRAEGSFKDFLAGSGHNLLSGWEAMAELTPSCWFQDRGAPTDMFDEFVEGKGVDKDSQAYDSGDDAAEVAGWLTGIGGLAKTLMKKLVKKGEKKADDLHAYYVLAGETPVLVHNSEGCPGGVDDVWHEGTFENPADSFEYHWKKHGEPLNIMPEKYL
ncbi:hypothetical protein AQJ46_17395 [Streptomyces canus]|uniref:Uncharacterized protein n=1 Tax=Streptomyces canus TaxID=58343 RepID=A0A101SA77_9ACTN|nr:MULTISPECIES: hypothetical protein [Streptomyces]KUN70147.1 hypothetical protein AQJ46_17395 [Streptomyces canus]MDI5910874.1 hypothetical protein [Streptomyces sp. 12257]